LPLVRKTLANLESDERDARDRKVLTALPEGLRDRLEVRAVDELHHDEVGVVADADIEHLDAVGMREVRRQARLVQEHRNELLLLGQMRQDALDRDLLLEALQPLALGSEHLGHAARFKLLYDAVALLRIAHCGSGERGPEGRLES
jgi:hypothetical protein